MPETISKPIGTYFRFEKDFVENGVRCIPMIVRFKLDAVGIKLKLREWAKFNSRERKYLSVKSCETPVDLYNYQIYLRQLIRLHTASDATELPIDQNPAWQAVSQVSEELQAHAELYGWSLSLTQWQSLSDLQRFALIKLCREGHENKNFPMAMREFNLVN